MHEGCIVMDGPPQVVFDQGERLRALGLDLPFPVQISHRLREGGLALPPGLLTIQDLAGALC
jgi:energy-coupling factor transport system ATP-binding protein